MKKTFIVSALCILLILPSLIFAQAEAAKPKSDARKAVENITAAQLKDYLYYVASDEMEGRDTPSRGLDSTAKFIATLLSRWGFKPAGDDGTFLQHIELSRYVVNAATTSVEIGGKPLAYGTDYMTGPSTSSLSNAPLVFAGNGWFIKSKNIDPLKDVDVTGKIVVAYADNFPRGISRFQELLALGKQGEDWINPVNYAKKKGAVGLIYINTPDTQKNWDRNRANREHGALVPDKFRKGLDNFPVVYLSTNAAEHLFEGESASLAQIASAYGNAGETLPSFAVGAGKNASVSIMPTRETASTQNVVALFEGSDPKLKNEMVAIGAHYDHVGMNPNAQGKDKIWNGADDDGSGTVSILGMAEALAKSPRRPKRSILFVWHCGEEKGLWGSEYFNKFPTVDIKNVITQLNIDMIGRSLDPNNIIKCDKLGKPCNENLSGANGVYVIGAEMMSSTLGSIVKGINSAYLNIGYDYRFDDPKDTNRFFFRSDHFNYAQNGIPITFWFDGVHEDYHQPGDEPQKIDYVKMEKVARTIFLTMWEVADLKERPKVDKDLPPELVRKNN
jgi:hypothetical protein